MDASALPGRPDIVFASARVVVFVDGDFWHGRDLSARLGKLQRGHNAPYWVAKITGNVARDVRNTSKLIEQGWTVMRFWETDVKRDAPTIAREIVAVVNERRATPQR